MSQKNKNTINNSKKVQPAPKPSFVTSAPVKEKKQSKFSTISKKEGIVTTILALVVFVVLAFYELVVNNSDTLFMAQGRSLFTDNCQFFKALCTSPGCVIAWLGCYLTQYFYYPNIGSAILIAIWCVTYFVTKKAFKLNNNWSFLAILPISCLLVSIIDNGYWLYYIKQPGYWFRESLGFLFTVSCVYLCTCFKKNLVLKCVLVTLIAAFGYYAFGYYALLAILYVGIIEWLNTNFSVMQKSILTILVMILLIAVPMITCNLFFTEIRAEEALYGGFPQFNMDKYHSVLCETPFYILCVVPLLLIFVSALQEKKAISGLSAYIYRFAFIVILLGVSYVVDSKNFDNYNYHAEFRMYRATDECRWDDVLEESANYQTDPTREMVILNHIALLNKGNMGTDMFKYNNFGEPPYVIDSLSVHMVQTAGPIIYYNHAKTNYAIRWCIENSVEYGYSFNETKILIRSALVNGEWDVARKYINILKHSKYYKEWAEKYEPILKNHLLIKKYPEFDNIIELYNNMGSVLDGDNGLCEMYILNYFANTLNKDSNLLGELTLNYALLQKDIQLFWPRFFLYAQKHKGQEMPIHYQEAAYLYGNLEHQVDISHMPFNKDVIERYASFQQVSQQYLQQGMQAQQVGELMKSQFGNTFYWFYFFCRDVKSY